MFPGATRRQREAALQASKTFTTSQQLLEQWSQRLLNSEERTTLYSFYNEYQSTKQVHVFVYRCAQLLQTPQKRYLVVALRNVISPVDRAKFDKYVYEYGLQSDRPTSTSPSLPSRPHSSPVGDTRRSTTPISSDLSGSWPASGFATSPRRRPASVSSERDRNAVRKLIIRRTSESEGLGFSFRGGAEHKIGLYVSCVDAGSAAEKSGMKAGMQLMKANDVSLEEVTTEQAIRILKGSKKLKLSVIDKGMYPGTYVAHRQHRWVDPQGRLTSPPPETKTSERRQSEGQSGGRSEMRLLSNSDERKVNVLVRDGQKLGMSIRGGVEMGVGIYVSSVDENSVAEHAGLRAGDQILDVNGESLLEATHLEATNMLKSQDHLMVMTIRDVGKIPHSTVKYDHSNWVYCNEQQNGDVSLRDRSATLPARLRHKAEPMSEETNTYFREQPSAEFSTFKASDDKEKTKRQSTIFKQGMGTQLVMKTTQVSTARAEIESKAQHILTEHELSSLHYYLSQYQDGHVHVDDLVTALRNILDTVEKAALVNEIRQIVTPRDLDRFESLMRETEMEVLRERRRLESINRMKAAAVITDSPPVRRQAIPGSSQVDVRHSPSRQRTDMASRNNAYSPDSRRDEDDTSRRNSPLIHQVATLAVVHKSATNQQEDEEQHDESENSETENSETENSETENSSDTEDAQEYTLHHAPSDTTSEVSETAVLVAVNAIASAADESDKEETVTNEDTSEESREDIRDEIREETRDHDDELNVDEIEENVVVNTRGGLAVECDEPPVFHVPAPPDNDEDSESEHEDEQLPDKQENVVPVIQQAAAPIKQIASYKSNVSRRPPVFMAPPPPADEHEASRTPPVFHVPRPPTDEYIGSSDDDTEAMATADKEANEPALQAEDKDTIVSPDAHQVLQETMQQRRRRINPGSVYIRERANRSVSVDSSTTEMSADETWDPSFQDTPTVDFPVTSTPSKQEPENVPKLVIDHENTEVITTQAAYEEDNVTDGGDADREVNPSLETPDTERKGPTEDIEQTVDDVNVRQVGVSSVVFKDEREENGEPQGMMQDVPQPEVQAAVVTRDKQQQLETGEDRATAEHGLEQHTDAQDNPEHKPHQPTHPEPTQTTHETLTPAATSTPIKLEDPYAIPYKPSRSEIYATPEKPKPNNEDIYAIPNKQRKSSRPTQESEPKREPQTVAGFTGLTGTIITVLVPKNKPRLGMSVNGGSNTKQKEVRLRDVQSNGCAAAVMPPLKLGQQILSVDNHSLKGLTHRQAVEVIKQSFGSRRTEMEITVHEDEEVERLGNKN